MPRAPVALTVRTQICLVIQLLALFLNAGQRPRARVFRRVVHREQAGRRSAPATPGWGRDADGSLTEGRVLIVGPSGRPTAGWALPAEPSAVSQLRRRATEFASTAGASDKVIQAIALAVSETVTNAVVHAYDGEDRGAVRVRCHVDGERFIVEVADEGIGIGSRHRTPGIGHGLAMVGAVVQKLDVASGSDGRGTAVTMAFGPDPPRTAPPGLETLCPLALETVADVSCLDLVHEGVLRRVAAEVADDPSLTTWLRTAVPPAKPGTATWSALREGGARLVVHDPTVPRSPGGPGERLNLAWWVAVALGKSDGKTAAIWGFGGRRGGHPVPSEQVLRICADAAGGDLAQPAERGALRGRLAMARR
jgi:anti-sigma regulatory factor (Ser/Thr protein kinase)